MGEGTGPEDWQSGSPHSEWDGSIEREWGARLEAEVWIDVREWAPSHGVEVSLPGRAAWTRALLDAIESPSFAEARSRVPGGAGPWNRSAHAARRGRYVLTRAVLALERALKAPEAPSRFTVDFAAPLHSRADRPAWQILRLRAEGSPAGTHDLLIGLPRELRARPLL